MERIHLIGWALLLLLAVGSAITVTVSTVEEGKAKLGESIQLEEVGCKVYEITKSGTTAEELDNADFRASFALEYKLDGAFMPPIVRVVHVKNDTEAEVAAATESQCEADWLLAQERHEKVDKVIVNPKTNPILNKIYNTVTKVWKLK